MKCSYNNYIYLPTPPFDRSVSAKECGRRAREGVRDEKWWEEGEYWRIDDNRFRARALLATVNWHLRITIQYMICCPIIFKIKRITETFDTS